MLAEQESMTDTSIAIVDLGGQYCHMISRRLRDIGIDSRIVPADVGSDEVADCSGIILSGGPQSVYDKKNSPGVNNALFHLNIPVLGICYGHQLLAQELGARVEPGSEEYGASDLRLRETDTLFTGTPMQQRVWMSHSDTVVDLPAGATLLATTDRCEVAAFAHMERRFFGVQFHPEVTHTHHGENVLENFVLKICNLTSDQSVEDRVPRLISRIQAEVGSKSVFFLVSGGVDSTVAFALCARALPADRVLGVYVDTGLMRERETAELGDLLAELGISDRLRIRHEGRRFTEALAGVTDPEEKRAIIGRLFLDVQSEAFKEYGIVDGDDWLIGQGTIYPDTIESGGGGSAAKIKTHHNRCGEMMDLIKQGRVIEPLKEYYKDEVRKIGRELGISAKLTQRWPFPGPGLAIRVLCTEEGTATAPLNVALPDAPGFRGVSLPIRSVGVQGDGRTYRDLVALEGPIDYPRLEALGAHLCNIGRAHNRVIVKVAGEGAIEEGRVLPNRTITPDRLALLRRADFIVRNTMARRDLTDTVWQFPVVLIPVSFGPGEGETIVLRPVDSHDGMTASFSHLPVDVLGEIGAEISRLDGVSAVFLDVSDKPPATIEWE